MRSLFLSTLFTAAVCLPLFGQINSLAPNHFYDLAQALKNPEQVYHLDLSYQDLKEVPNDIFKLPNLRILDLSGNFLSELPYEFGELNGLEQLYLNHNLFAVFPHEILDLEKLKVLEISGNGEPVYDVLEVLSSASPQYPNSSGFIQLPEEINQLQNLELLDLRFHQLDRLPASLAEMINLKEFRLQANKFTELPLVIPQISSLETLDLSFNQINTFPVELLQLKSLKHLNLQGQFIDCEGNDEVMQRKVFRLPEDIHVLASLEVLDLYGNDINELPDTFFTLQQLRVLNLSSNPIGHQISAFCKMPQLQQLNLSGIAQEEEVVAKINDVQNCLTGCKILY